MRRPGTAQLELPLLACEPASAPPVPLAPRPATACTRCGWYCEHAVCPACGATTPSCATATPGATTPSCATTVTPSPGAIGPRLPPLRRPRREPAP